MPPRHMLPRRAGGDAPVRDRSMSRLDRIAAAIESIQQTIDAQFKRIAAMQVEIHLMRAKRRSS